MTVTITPHEDPSRQPAIAFTWDDEHHVFPSAEEAYDWLEAEAIGYRRHIDHMSQRIRDSRNSRKIARRELSLVQALADTVAKHL